MSDEIKASHTVGQIPAGDKVSPVQRTETAKTNEIPDYQGAAADYAENTNWMSRLGSSVATNASNEIAKELGASAGKNPHGGLGPELTEFDKAMTKSYETQAQSTLGLQAQKVITESNIALASANRLTPDLIAKSQQSIYQSLQKIYSLAPDSIRPEMERQYGSMMLSQLEHLNNRMTSEQKEDRINILDASTKSNAENAHSLSMSGDDKGALAAVQATEKAYSSAVETRDKTFKEKQVAVDTAKISYLSGKYTRQAQIEESKGKLGEFYKSLADNPPKDVPDKYHADVYNNVQQYMNQQAGLRSQDQQLQIAKFNTLLARDLSSAPQALSELQNNVTPIEFEKAQLRYLNALKSVNDAQLSTQEVSKVWGDPEQFAHLTDKAVNRNFDLFTQKYQQNNQGVTHDDAQVIVAASAGGKIGVFTDTLKNKIHSGNPAQMDSAGNQIEELRSMNAGHALTGLNDSDKAIVGQYNSLRDSLPPDEAAKIAIQNANQDPEQIKANNEAYHGYLKKETGNFNKSPAKFALEDIAKLKTSQFMNVGTANAYGNFILQKFETYYQMTNRDQKLATTLTKRDVDENFGYTEVNGNKTMTLHPLEKVLGYEDNHDVVPYIQQDVMRKLNERFVPLKEAYNTRSEYVSKPGQEHFKSNEYWDIVAPTDKKKPIQVKHYLRSGNKTQSQTYDVALIGNSFNWDISLATNSGIRPMMQLAPYLGIHTYTPDKKFIDSQYLAASKKGAR